MNKTIKEFEKWIVEDSKYLLTPEIFIKTSGATGIKRTYKNQEVELQFRAYIAGRKIIKHKRFHRCIACEHYLYKNAQHPPFFFGWCRKLKLYVMPNRIVFCKIEQVCHGYKEK